MAQNHEIADALERVHLNGKGRSRSLLLSQDISRADRELLTRTHWLEPIIKGWYMLVSPEAERGDSSIWYANFWEFVKLYLEAQYPDGYCLSAENSIDLHLRSPTIPRQVIAIVRKGGGRAIHLPFQTSLLPYENKENFPVEITEIDGVCVMELPLALCKVAPSFFEKDPKGAALALQQLKDPSDLLSVIAKHRLYRASGRLVGAFRFIGADQFADQLVQGLKELSIPMRQENPFQEKEPLHISSGPSPHVTRILALWEDYRKPILDLFPEEPGMPDDGKNYLEKMEELFREDAYHSLSIEGFQITPELIERVRDQAWDPTNNRQDQNSRNALAARGYFQAFKTVKTSIKNIFAGEPPGKEFQKSLPQIHKSLFFSSVEAGIIREADLLGFRRGQVYIQNSRHVPLPKESLLDAMEALYTCLIKEESAAVRALLGHYIFVYIHPYFDGNGRIARFLMNMMFASGGYRWTIIPVERRRDYIDALECAHVEQNILPFVQFVLSLFV